MFLLLQACTSLSRFFLFSHPVSFTAPCSDSSHQLSFLHTSTVPSSPILPASSVTTYAASFRHLPRSTFPPSSASVETLWLQECLGSLHLLQTNNRYVSLRPNPASNHSYVIHSFTVNSSFTSSSSDLIPLLRTLCSFTTSVADYVHHYFVTIRFRLLSYVALAFIGFSSSLDSHSRFSSYAPPSCCRILSSRLLQLPTSLLAFSGPSSRSFRPPSFFFVPIIFFPSFFHT